MNIQILIKNSLSFKIVSSFNADFPFVYNKRKWVSEADWSYIKNIEIGGELEESIKSHCDFYRWSNPSEKNILLTSLRETILTCQQWITICHNEHKSEASSHS